MVPIGHLRGQLRQASDVVVVQMRGDEEVEPVHPGRAHCGHHAGGVAAFALTVAGVDEHGFTGRRHQQRRGAALDVDEVDLQ